jgi:hypothetical protein
MIAMKNRYLIALALLAAWTVTPAQAIPQATSAQPAHIPAFEQSPAFNSPGALAVCPILPANSGMRWILQSGPDFSVCYAVAKSVNRSVIGVYLGNYPGFQPANATPIGKGTVAGRKVLWYHGEPGDHESLLARQTLITLNQGGSYMAHVWVSATTKAELESRLAVLAHMRFQK